MGFAENAKQIKKFVKVPKLKNTIEFSENKKIVIRK